MRAQTLLGVILLIGLVLALAVKVQDGTLNTFYAFMGGFGVAFALVNLVEGLTS